MLPTRADDRNVYLPGGCYRLVAHFADWQVFAKTWAANATSLSFGRSSSNFCGITPASPSPSGSPSASLGGSPRTAPPGQRTPAPTPAPTPRPTATKKP